mgnify:CR=1 FL=1
MDKNKKEGKWDIIVLVAELLLLIGIIIALVSILPALAHT